jgi:hypothetical protein
MASGDYMAPRPSKYYTEFFFFPGKATVTTLESPGPVRLGAQTACLSATRVTEFERHQYIVQAPHKRAIPRLPTALK